MQSCPPMSKKHSKKWEYVERSRALRRAAREKTNAAYQDRDCLRCYRFAFVRLHWPPLRR